MNSSTCHVHKHLETRVSLAAMYTDKLKSIRTLTSYVIPRYGGHGVMDGYEGR